MWNLYDEAITELKKRFDTEDEERLIKACVCAIYQNTNMCDGLTKNAKWMTKLLTKVMNVFLGKY